LRSFSWRVVHTTTRMRHDGSVRSQRVITVRNARRARFVHVGATVRDLRRMSPCRAGGVVTSDRVSSPRPPQRS
jgi:hypothetical protein